MADSFPRGQFVWHELMTTDPDAAVAFYTKVIGWTTTSYESDPNYRIWMSGQLPQGGLMRLPEEARSMGSHPHWLPYVAVPDVDAAERQTVAMGGKVYVGAQDIAVGRFAVLTDPQGATFAVYRPAREPVGANATPARGEFCWHELATTDPTAAWAFYHALFGWSKTSAMDMGPAGVYQMFGAGGPPLGGIYSKSAEMPGPPRWLCYIEVASVEKVAALLPKLGGRVASGPMEVPGGARIAMCLDAQHAPFAVHAVKAAPTKVATTTPAAKPVAEKTAKPAVRETAKPAALKTAKPVARKTVKPAPKKKAKPAAKKQKSARVTKRKKATPAKARRKPARPAKRRKTNKPARRTAPRRKAKKKARRR